MAYLYEESGIKDDNNSTIETIAASGEWLGDWTETTKFATIAATITGTGNAVMYFQFSIDGVTLDREIQVTNSGLTPAGTIHSVIVVAPYFRIRVENETAAPNDLRLVSLLHRNAKIAAPTARLKDSYNGRNDCIPVKVINNTAFDEAVGRAQDRIQVAKFGENPNIAASTTEYITTSGQLFFQQTAQTLRIRSGGNANDDATGSGARKITVQGLDANFKLYEEDIITAGTSQSGATTGTFFRVFRAFVSETGTYGGTNAGDITLEYSTSTDEAILISAGVSQSEHAAYTIPAGYQAILRRVDATVESGKPADIAIWVRNNADNTTVPFSASRRLLHAIGIDGSLDRDYRAYPRLPEKTDIWMTSTAGASTVGVVGAFDLVLVDITN